MDAVHPDDRDAFLEDFHAAMAHSKALGGRTLSRCIISRLQRKTGDYIWVETVKCITPTHCYAVRRCVACGCTVLLVALRS
jgi:hypothetical protein